MIYPLYFSLKVHQIDSSNSEMCKILLDSHRHIDSHSHRHIDSLRCTQHSLMTHPVGTHLRVILHCRSSDHTIKKLLNSCPNLSPQHLPINVSLH